MYMSIILVAVIISLCICMSKHVVHGRYIQLVFVNYTSVKLGEKTKMVDQEVFRLTEGELFRNIILI